MLLLILLHLLCAFAACYCTLHCIRIYLHSRDEAPEPERADLLLALCIGLFAVVTMLEGMAFLYFFTMAF